MSDTDWHEAGIGDAGFATAAVGPFRLRAAANVFAVTSPAWGASGMAFSLDAAKRRAVVVLRKHLEEWPEATIEGRLVEELLGELDALEPGPL